MQLLLGTPDLSHALTAHSFMCRVCLQLAQTHLLMGVMNEFCTNIVILFKRQLGFCGIRKYE
jgi:hypothetical protein